jgi:HD-GYP domain-containing protein (c-di-GMP phosphodiesterase class II)
MLKCLLCDILPALSLVIDYQEKGNIYHAWRVALISHYLTEAAGLDKNGIIFYSALLHDIGIFGLGEHIINYPDLGIQKEIPAIKIHPAIGADIVKEIPGLSRGADFILEHHERSDGSGYPQGKKENKISFNAQIIRLSDSIDLLMRRKPKPGKEGIAQYCREQKGKEISEKIYDLFSDAYKSDNGEFLSAIDEDEKVKSIFTEVIKSVPEPKANISGDSLEVILKIFSRIIDGKHRYTHQHSQRVAAYAYDIAEAMGIDKAEARKIKFSGYLHDLGKVAIPNYILDKPGPLSAEEWEIIKRHAFISYEIADSVEALKDLAPLVGAAQEFWDGMGYPSGLKGEETPLGARIISVADAIDAMLSDRAYRKALSVEKAKEELKKNSWSQFDPLVTKVALGILDSNKWRLEK